MTTMRDSCRLCDAVIMTDMLNTVDDWANTKEKHAIARAHHTEATGHNDFARYVAPDERPTLPELLDDDDEDDRERPLAVLIGVTLATARGAKGDKEMVLTETSGRRWRFFHRQDCCENVAIEDVCGDLDDLVGSRIVLAEETSNRQRKRRDLDSQTWTFYRLGTEKGTVTVRWLGTSNGYYSEAVSFEEMA